VESYTVCCHKDNLTNVSCTKKLASDDSIVCSKEQKQPKMMMAPYSQAADHDRPGFAQEDEDSLKRNATSSNYEPASVS